MQIRVLPTYIKFWNGRQEGIRTTLSAGEVFILGPPVPIGKLKVRKELLANQSGDLVDGLMKE